MGSRSFLLYRGRLLAAAPFSRPGRRGLGPRPRRPWLRGCRSVRSASCVDRLPVGNLASAIRFHGIGGSRTVRAGSLHPGVHDEFRDAGVRRFRPQRTRFSVLDLPGPLDPYSQRVRGEQGAAPNRRPWCRAHAGLHDPIRGMGNHGFCRSCRDLPQSPPAGSVLAVVGACPARCADRGVGDLFLFALRGSDPFFEARGGLR